MTNKKFSKKLFSDLIFATKVVKHVNQMQSFYAVTNKL